MSTNNQAQDRYNAPNNTEVDFETFIFSDLPVGELFWLTSNPNGNVNTVHRKINESEGTDLKTQVTSQFEHRAKVYQKT